MNATPDIYLDNAASTPVDTQVLDAMLPYLGQVFGNPSSAHAHGQKARRALDVAREEVAALIGAQPEEIVFTSGGTEACNLALQGHCLAPAAAAPRLLLSAIEHDAVRRAAERLAETGMASCERVGVTAQARVDLEHYDACLKRGATLVSIMTANNDVGTIQPVAELAARAQSAGALFHTDAVQAIGKIPVKVTESGVDMMSFSAHKVYGPKGVGALYLRRSTRIAPLVQGGSQESRRRAGTENLAGIVGFGRACALASVRLERDAAHINALRERFERYLATIDNIRIHGEPAARLPGILSVSTPGLSGEALMMAMDMAGISISTGSACHSDSVDPSRTLTAMGVSPSLSRSMIRISLGRQNTAHEVEHAAQALVSAVARLRALESS